MSRSKMGEKQINSLAQNLILCDKQHNDYLDNQVKDTMWVSKQLGYSKDGNTADCNSTAVTKGAFWGCRMNLSHLILGPSRHRRSHTVATSLLYKEFQGWWQLPFLHRRSIKQDERKLLLMMCSGLSLARQPSAILQAKLIPLRWIRPEESQTSWVSVDQKVLQLWSRVHSFRCCRALSVTSICSGGIDYRYFPRYCVDV